MKIFYRWEKRYDKESKKYKYHDYHGINGNFIYDVSISALLCSLKIRWRSQMGVTQRVLMCRLIEKMKSQKSYSKKLGIENASTFRGKKLVV